MQKHANRQVEFSPRSEGQKELLESMYHNDITIGIGPAGTGKTYLAAMKAIQLYEDRTVNKIILARPAVSADEDLGFLPGDMNEKLHPYMFPLLDAFSHHWHPGRLYEMQKDEEAEIASVGHMRGRSFYNSVIIIDEAQNLTYAQLKMILTRFGAGCKMIITGDPDQVDLDPNDRKDSKRKSGLMDWVRILKGLPKIGVVEMSTDDIQRHPLIEKILKEEMKYQSNLKVAPI